MTPCLRLFTGILDGMAHPCIPLGLPASCSHSQRSVLNVLLQQLRGVATAGKPAPAPQQVQVVLLKDVRGLGRKGEVRPASPGWMRHHLFPRGAAMYATPENVNKYALDAMNSGAREDTTSDEGMERQLVRMLRALSRRVVDISRKAVQVSVPIHDGDPAAVNPASRLEQPDVGKEEERMKGTVTAYDVQTAVSRQLGVLLHESHLLMGAPITQFGTFKVPLNLRMLDDHQVELTVRVHKVKQIRYGKAST